MEPVGYVKLFRSIESSEDFAGLRADQAWVAVRILQLANFKPAFHSFRGHPIRVERGELAHTLETIAARAHTTIKVVRTTIARLQRTGFLGTRTGTVAGTPYRILIVKNYERFQGEDSGEGTAAGTAAGSDRARTGHESGTDRALREEGEEGKKETLALAPLGAPPKAAKEKHPTALRRSLSDALVAAYAVARGTPYGWDGVKDGAALSRLLDWSKDVNEHARRWRLAISAPQDSFHRVDSVAAFATSRIWNHYAPNVAASSGPRLKTLTPGAA